MQEMKTGERAFFYHSNCKPPGIAGTVRIAREAYPDFTSWDKKDPHFDPKSSQEKPRWYMVDVTLDEIYEEVIPLKLLQEHSVSLGEGNVHGHCV